MHRALDLISASWLKMNAWKAPCPRSYVASATPALSCADLSLRDLGYNMGFSPTPMVRAFHGSQHSSGGESAQRSGSQICFLAKNEGPKGTLSQKLCHLRDFLCRLVSFRPKIQDGILTWSCRQRAMGSFLVCINKSKYSLKNHFYSSYCN